MKVKVINRSSQDYLRDTKYDLHKVPRNYDPTLHPFSLQREYQRALNSVKLDKIFAKPFLFALSGHIDPVECLLKHPVSLSTLISGSFDGQIKIWDLMSRKCLRTIDAHSSAINGICSPHHGNYFFTIGDNSIIKQWKLTPKEQLIEDDDDDDDEEISDTNQPLNSIVAKSTIIGIDHHISKSQFITCGQTIDLWDENRPASLKTYNPSIDSTYKVKFNPIEQDIFACAGNDRSITLFDSRKNEHLRKVILSMRSNNISWNPMEAFHFTVANEDHNLYTFDMRNLKSPYTVHVDHISAVIDVDYAPTGKEFTSGSYDKTLRIFPYQANRSREIYHTKRMQRLTSIIWTLDNKYIICGSNETDIRVWKANASEKLGIKSSREENAFRYQDKLKEKFKLHPEIFRIARHRHLPKHVYHGRKEKMAMLKSIKRKEDNRRLHSKPGTLPRKILKQKAIVKEIE